jgi:hypothetical protein
MSFNILNDMTNCTLLNLRNKILTIKWTNGNDHFRDKASNTHVQKKKMSILTGTNISG